jgi:transposase, IS5 family
MEKQMSFAQAEFAGKKRTTRREKFLGDMEKVVPWSRLVGVIEPHYPKGERGRPPVGIERMLRIYCHRTLQSVPPWVDSKCTTRAGLFKRV